MKHRFADLIISIAVAGAAIGALGLVYAFCYTLATYPAQTILIAAVLLYKRKF